MGAELAVTCHDFLVRLAADRLAPGDRVGDSGLTGRIWADIAISPDFEPEFHGMPLVAESGGSLSSTD